MFARNFGESADIGIFREAMPSFDIVSKVQWNEVDNALNQAQKEIAQRFDFKDTETELEKNDAGIVVRSSSLDRARAGLTVLQEKLIKRKVSLKFLHVDDPKPTAKGGSRIQVNIKEGIEADPARKIVTAIKELKLKVQAAIQEAQVRVTGKNRDDLQKVIALVRNLDLGIEISAGNFRD
ncbi:MAG: YajQ family cyclic di-GMP-binding protein [Polyangiaceae bacterium]|nr:YajQ family cyclic di-GMP-binding protein [Polyangiaceae bacterium]